MTLLRERRKSLLLSQKLRHVCKTEEIPIRKTWKRVKKLFEKVRYKTRPKTSFIKTKIVPLKAQSTKERIVICNSEIVRYEDTVTTPLPAVTMHQWNLWSWLMTKGTFLTKLDLLFCLTRRWMWFILKYVWYCTDALSTLRAAQPCFKTKTMSRSLAHSFGWWVHGYPLGSYAYGRRTGWTSKVETSSTPIWKWDWVQLLHLQSAGAGQSEIYNPTWFW